MISSTRRPINLFLSLLGIGIVLYYTVCDQSCAYLRGRILFVDIKYVGMLFMGLVVCLTVWKANPFLLPLLSAAVGVEIYLLGFQVKNGVYCPYCLAFAGVILALFVWNFDASRKRMAVASAAIGLVLISIFFEGSVIPLYG